MAVPEALAIDKALVLLVVAGWILAPVAKTILPELATVNLLVPANCKLSKSPSIKRFTVKDPWEYLVV